MRERGDVPLLRDGAAPDAPAGRPAARRATAVTGRCARSSRWPAASSTPTPRCCRRSATATSTCAGARARPATSGRSSRCATRSASGCWTGGSARVVPDATLEPSLNQLAGVRTARSRAYIGVPFETEDARAYVLCCLAREARPDLGEADVRFLQGVAESLRAAARALVKRARLLARRRVAARRLRLAAAAAARRSRGRAAAAAARCGCRRSARSTRRSTSPRRPATSARVRGRAGRQGARRARRQDARHAVPRRQRQDQHRRRAGPAVDRLRARLRVERAVLRLLHRHRRRRRRRRVQARAPRTRPTPAPRARCCSQRQTRSPTTTAACCSSGPTSCSTSASGDGGGGGDQHGARGNGQSLGTLLGKILRIDPRAAGAQAVHGPVRQPVRRPLGRAPEIYSYGLRNPWRFSFDRKTGDLTIGDVGQDEVEEIDFVRKGKGRGANFGWRVFEGNDRYTPGESAPGRDQAGDHRDATRTATARSPAAS